MGYAIQTEREAIVKEGLNPDREPSRWLQVLGVIQKGVMAELQKSVHKDVEVRFRIVVVSFFLKLRRENVNVPHRFTAQASQLTNENRPQRGVGVQAHGGGCLLVCLFAFLAGKPRKLDRFSSAIAFTPQLTPLNGDGMERSPSSSRTALSCTRQYPTSFGSPSRTSDWLS